MSTSRPHAAVMGTGSWGTTFAMVLADAGVPVRMWGRRSEVVDEIASQHRNSDYLPGVELPHQAAPRMGEHTEAMLREAGFYAAAIAKLRTLGVIDGATAPAGHSTSPDAGHAAGPAAPPPRRRTGSSRRPPGQRRRPARQGRRLGGAPRRSRGGELQG